MQIAGALNQYVQITSYNQRGDRAYSKKETTSADSSQETKEATTTPKSTTDTSKQALSEQERTEVEQLQQRDQEVRTHEAAHKAAAGQYAKGGASFDYERGPDGQLYAVGGEVSIDTSKIPDNPEATLQKANQIRNAALAPAQPSTQDRAVAVEAAAMAAEAKAEIAKQGLSQGDGPTRQYDAVAKLNPDEKPTLDLQA